MRICNLLIVCAALGGCASTPIVLPSSTPTPRPVAAAPPPMQPQVAPSSGSFIAPTLQQGPGLAGIIGAGEGALTDMFGQPRLRVREGDALKLQFSGRACVMDIFLYPLSQGASQSAAHVETRRASDGQDVDRAACISALRR